MIRRKLLIGILALSLTVAGPAFGGACKLTLLQANTKFAEAAQVELGVAPHVDLYTGSDVTKLRTFIVTQFPNVPPADKIEVLTAKGSDRAVIVLSLGGCVTGTYGAPAEAVASTIRRVLGPSA